MVSLLRRFAVPIFWVAVTIVYVLAIVPAPQAPDLGAGDKVNHIAAFLTLTVLGRAAYRMVPAWRLATGLSLFGILIELTQAIPFLNRDASFGDWIADSGAIVIALVAMLLFERCRPVRGAA